MIVLHNGSGHGWRTLAYAGALGLAVLLMSVQAFAQATAPLDLSAAERRYLDEKGTLRLCVDPDRMPFDGLDEEGRHDGLSGEYFDNFARLLEVPMVVHPVENWEDLMQAARARDCDIITQINASAERRAFLDFTSPYFILPLAVVTRYDRIFVEDSLEGAGNTFAVIAGDIAIAKLKARYPGVDLLEVRNNIEGLQKVQNGEVFGYIGAQGAVAFALQAADMDQLAVTGSLPLSYRLGVATRNDEPLLGQIMEKAVQAIDPKEAQRIRNKWIAITIEQVTDYTLLYQVLGVAGLLLGLSFFWNRRLSTANRKIQDTVAELNAAQAQLKLQNVQLKRQSVTDPLTQVYNRLKLDDAIAVETRRAERSGEAFAIVLLDIDHFKRINDAHGHQMGDDVLVRFAEILTATARQIDVVGRWGGEEFLILCPATDLNGGQVLAEHIRDRLADEVFADGQAHSASFGVAQFEPGDRSDDVIARADAALYRAKTQGRNRVDVQVS